MPLSRLRLRLAGWFALCLLASLAVLDLSHWYLRSHADRRLTRDLESAANQLAAASRREFEESPARGLPEAARNAVEEWPAGPEAVAVYDAAGRLVARGGPADLSAFVPSTAPIGTTDVPLRGDEAAARLVPSSSDGAPRFTALVVGSTERVTEDGEALAWWLALKRAVGRRAVARRRLSHFPSCAPPLGELERAVAAVGPAQLDRRLPVTERLTKSGGWRFNQRAPGAARGVTGAGPAVSPPSRAPDPDAADARARRIRAQPRPAPVQRGLS